MPPSPAATNEDDDNDEIDDALSPEFRTLLATLTREEVDKYQTRCPHVETSERMTKVRRHRVVEALRILNGK